MAMSMGKIAAAPGGVKSKKGKAKKTGLTLGEFLDRGDFTGAVALLEFKIRTGDTDETTLPWLAYCAFHRGDYKKALSVYEQIEKAGDSTPELGVYKACSLFYLGRFAEAEELLAAAPSADLRNRVMFHIANRVGDEDLLRERHGTLRLTTEDQLALAAVHYQREHYQQATDVYKRLLLENPSSVALNVYIAMCYYKLDYYDVSLEILGTYLEHFPRSAVAINLKACNHYKMYNGKSAEADLKELGGDVAAQLGLRGAGAGSGAGSAVSGAGAGGSSAAAAATNMLEESDLIRHNLVVFRGGEGAVRVLKPLAAHLSEARLNLCVYHLRQGDVKSAQRVIEEKVATTVPEFQLAGVIHSELGQRNGSKEDLQKAQQYFQRVGMSPEDKDTISGRQCAASLYILMRDFYNANIYLESIKSFMYNDDTFNWNYGIAQAAEGHYLEAEQSLQRITDPSMTQDFVYLSWLARCFIMNGKAKLAWELYLRLESTNADALSLLQLIAADSYKMGAFLVAAKAFDVLEKIDPDPEYWEGKRGACVGVFQLVCAEQEPVESLREVFDMLSTTANPQQKHIVEVIRQYAESQGWPL